MKRLVAVVLILAVAATVSAAPPAKAAPKYNAAQCGALKAERDAASLLADRAMDEFQQAVARDAEAEELFASLDVLLAVYKELNGVTRQLYRGCYGKPAPKGLPETREDFLK